jgi:iron complex outermembrane receptor protein
LSIVIGGVLLEPRLLTTAASPTIGRRPAGVPRLRAIANLDYRTPFVKGLNLDAGVAFVGRRPARTATVGADGDQLFVGAMATASVGARYRFRVADQEVVARVQVQNLFNQQSWDVNSSETLTYSGPRRIRVAVTATF